MRQRDEHKQRDGVDRDCALSQDVPSVFTVQFHLVEGNTFELCQRAAHFLLCLSLLHALLCRLHFLPVAVLVGGETEGCTARNESEKSRRRKEKIEVAKSTSPGHSKGRGSTWYKETEAANRGGPCHTDLTAGRVTKSTWRGASLGNAGRWMGMEGKEERRTRFSFFMAAIFCPGRMGTGHGARQHEGARGRSVRSRFREGEGRGECKSGRSFSDEMWESSQRHTEGEGGDKRTRTRTRIQTHAHAHAHTHSANSRCVHLS